MKFTSLPTALCIVALTISFFTSAQSAENPNRIVHEIDSKIFNEPRTVLVNLPSGYRSQPNQKFAVMYVFDAQFEPYFSATAEMLRFYADLGDCIPMIVVGIKSTNRSKEFTPRYNHKNTFDGWRGNCGNADTLTAFLSEEVFPLINKNYRTIPYKLGVGHSLGGTFLFQDIFKATPLFNGIIAASPNLSYDFHQLVDSAKTYFAHSPNQNAFIFATCGTVGEMELDFNASLKSVDEIAKNSPHIKVDWNCQWMEGETHMSNYLPTVNHGLQAFAKNWIITEDKIELFLADTSKTIVAHIVDFYANLCEIATPPISPSADELNSFTYTVLYFGGAKKAESVINYATTNFPDNANLYDSRGEIQELQFNFYEARSSYKKAIEVLEETKNRYGNEDYENFKSMFSANLAKLTDDYIDYNLSIKDAGTAVHNKNYKKASKLYKKAFAQPLKNGSHMVRKTAVIAFAQTGDLDAAFEQLDLLANYFEWQGSESFEKDSLLDPLKKDARWAPLMKKMDANAK